MGKITALFILIFSFSLSAESTIWKENKKMKGLNPNGVVKLNDFAKLAKNLSPTVANIQVEVEIKTSTFRRPVDPFFDDPLHRFFDHFFDQPRSYKNRGIGSGVIINEDGYILTNNHVINNATSIKVTLLNDQNSYDAKIIGRDPKTDLALLKIDSKKKLPYAYLGDSEKLDIGEWVIAIGNPFGLQHTVTAGIVSAKGRKDVHPGNKTGYYNFIQTDASINPGNSGGPLFNINGEVIGINTAINASGQGIGFAIPINMAKKVISHILKYGKVKRSWLGVSIQKVSKELAESFNRKNTNGALVTYVVPDSPANKAGVLEGDIILTFDNKKIETSNDLPWLASMAGIGEKKEVTILRDGKIIKLDIVMGSFPGKNIVKNPTNDSSQNYSKLGFLVENISKNSDSNINFGVKVLSIKKDSPASRTGIMKGDIILRVNNRKILDKNIFSNELSKYKKGDVVRFYVKRGKNGLFFIALRI